MIVPLLLPIIAAAVSKGFAAAECLSNGQIGRSASAFCSAAAGFIPVWRAALMALAARGGS